MTSKSRSSSWRNGSPQLRCVPLMPMMRTSGSPSPRCRWWISWPLIVAVAMARTLVTSERGRGGAATVDDARRDDAADRPEEVALPRHPRRRHEPEEQRRAVDREDDDPAGDVGDAPAVEPACDEVRREAEDDAARADV